MTKEWFRVAPLGVAMFVLVLAPCSARAQAWDTGRNMFGFSQYYPGSGWSSFYHPNFDPDAFFPTTFGWRSAPRPAAPPPPAGTIYRGSPPRGLHARAQDRGWIFRRRRAR